MISKDSLEIVMVRKYAKTVKIKLSNLECVFGYAFRDINLYLMLIK